MDEEKRECQIKRRISDMIDLEGHCSVYYDLQIGCWSKAVKGRVRNLLKKDIRRGRTLGRSL